MSAEFTMLSLKQSTRYFDDDTAGNYYESSVSRDTINYYNIP